MKTVSSAQVLLLYEKMIKATGGSYGVRDNHALESSLGNAFATFDGIELYKSLQEKCANICYCIVKNHPFTDGNKRMGIYLMLILLEYNGIKITSSQEDLVMLGVGIAEGKIRQEEIVVWINSH